MKASRVRVILIASLVAIGGILLATVYIRGSSPVSDTFTDTSKIASNVNLTVDTANGQVKLATSSSWTCGDTITDSRDSKTYGTVLIDTQCWMAKNMDIGTKTAGVNNQGTACPSAAEIEKYCYGDSDDNCTSQGGLYQWDQAMCGSIESGTQGICPSGWHIPADSEQYTLEYYLWDKVTGTCASDRSGVYACSPAGTALKSGGTSGFNGLLAGFRYTDGSFYNQGSYAFFWSSTESGVNAWYRALYSGYATVGRFANDQANGFSVRCLKD